MRAAACEKKKKERKVTSTALGNNNNIHRQASKFKCRYGTQDTSTVAYWAREWVRRRESGSAKMHQEGRDLEISIEAQQEGQEIFLI